MTLQELAELVEGAEGPSRELDARIFHIIGSPLPSDFAGVKLALTFDEERNAFFMEAGEMIIRYEPPRYTCSLDAAMTLVPRGWLVSILRGFDDDGEYFAFIELTDSFTVGRGADPEEEVSVRARRGARKTFEDPTALALCAASLKALSKREGEDG